jgi:hypothetical protein
LAKLLRRRDETPTAGRYLGTFALPVKLRMMSPVILVILLSVVKVAKYEFIVNREAKDEENREKDQKVVQQNRSIV